MKISIPGEVYVPVGPTPGKGTLRILKNVDVHLITASVL